MRKSLVIIALAIVAGASFNTAEAAKKKKKTVEQPQPVVLPVQLASASDSVSYTAGMSFTNGLVPFLLQQGVDTTQMAEFIRGFKEVVSAGENPKVKAYVMGMQIADQVTSRMLPGVTQEFDGSPDSIIADKFYRGFTDALVNDTTVFDVKKAENYFKEKQIVDKAAKEEKLYGPNREAGKAFLAENAKKEGIITTPSGLQYKVLVQGEGEVPQLSDKVQVNYEGRLIDGTVFDASKKHGDAPSTFRPDQVIKGWTEALTMMPVGSKWQLFIPQELAYGERNMGQIQPYSALIFDVELVGIDKPKTEEPAKTAAKPVVKKSAAKKLKK